MTIVFFLDSSNRIGSKMWDGRDVASNLSNIKLILWLLNKCIHFS